MANTFTAWAIAALFWNLFACEFPHFPVPVGGASTWNLCVGKIWFLIGPYPTLHSQSPCANQNGNAVACYVCGDWLVCQTISVRKNPARILARVYCNSDGHIGSGDGTIETRWLDQGRVRLSAEPAFCAFSNTLCGMSHGDQHRPLVSVP